LHLRRLVLVLAVLLVGFIVATGFLFIWPSSDSAGHVDAVVVLSGGRDSRLDPAIRLVERHVAPVLVISGAGYDRKWIKARHLCAAGSKDFRVLCFNPKPYSTRGEAREIARLARRHHWERVDVVTSRYHIFRAGILVRRCFDGHVAMVGSSYPWKDAPVAWVSEWAKLAVQLTVQRSC
jgi:uncharacterized SAM-binding protein YcdF (DUF218 family)